MFDTTIDYTKFYSTSNLKTVAYLKYKMDIEPEHILRNGHVVMFFFENTTPLWEGLNAYHADTELKRYLLELDKTRHLLKVVE